MRKTVIVGRWARTFQRLQGGREAAATCPGDTAPRPARHSDVQVGAWTAFDTLAVSGPTRAKGKTVSTSGSLQILVYPHWVNAWLLVPFARPYVRVDGQEYTCRWNRQLRVAVPGGRHIVETFIRYRGAPIALG